MPMGGPVRHLTLLLAALTLVGCTEEREEGTPVACESFDPDLAPLLDTRCGACHSGAAPAGGYGLDSYAGVLGPGSDATANAIAGDATSLLLTVLEPATADADHQGFEDVQARLAPWVVDCALRYSDNPIHEAGLMNPDSSDFHGQLLRQAGYDYDVCRECHGDDFSGGTADAPCTTCHADGPTTCDTCHRDDLLDQGAHGAHVALVAGAPDFGACSTCHTTPADYPDPGHILLADGSVDDYPAELTFGALAATDPPGGDRSGPPSYDGAAGTCAQVYCHGDVFDDASATVTQPVWTGVDQATCGSCHGVAPASHASDACETCHQQVVGAGPTFLAPELHVDGVTQIGRHGSTCDSCHGTEGELASPPLDLTGGSSTDLVTVGTHWAHVTGYRSIAAPLDCSACHLEPTTLHSPGHIDSAWPAEVFPGGAAFPGIAVNDGAVPTWDRASATCSDVYCHGGGTRLGPSGDTSPGINRTPDFTAAFGGTIYCGSCHGIPPTGGIHDPGMTPFDCSGCHPASVDDFGGIIIGGTPAAPTSEHLDGSLN